MAKVAYSEEREIASSPENSAEFPRIGGVFLGPVPKIEEKFYAELLDELYASEAVVR